MRTFGNLLAFSPELWLVAGAALVFALARFTSGATTTAAALITIEMIVAGLTVNLARGFYWTKGGVEVPLIFAVLGAILALAGPGAASLDGFIWGGRSRPGITGPPASGSRPGS